MNQSTSTPSLARLLLSNAVTLVCLTTMVMAADRTGTTEQRNESKAVSGTPDLRREGTRFEGVGKFEISGDRVTFAPVTGRESFRVVENLALERVARVLGTNKEHREWNVAGVFLEYQGGNYLLLTRASLKQPVAKEPNRS